MERRESEKDRREAKSKKEFQDRQHKKALERNPIKSFGSMVNSHQKALKIIQVQKQIQHKQINDVRYAAVRFYHQLKDQKEKNPTIFYVLDDFIFEDQDKKFFIKLLEHNKGNELSVMYKLHMDEVLSKDKMNEFVDLWSKCGKNYDPYTLCKFENTSKVEG